MKTKIYVLAAMVLLLGACASNKKPKATSQPVAMVPKPMIVTREEWGSKAQPIDDSHKHTPKYITIHHNGVNWAPGTDPIKFVRNIQSWGQRRVAENDALPPEKRKPKIENWPDLPYHFMIAPDGRIFEGRPLEYEPQSNTDYPLTGHIGVELMGNFENERPSEQQLTSCVALVAWLCQSQHIDPSEIAGHRDRAQGQTVCPGKDFYRYLQDGEFVSWVKDTLAGKNPDVKPGPALEGGPTKVIDMTIKSGDDDDEKEEKKK
jgi:hypothetical protein